MFDVKYDPTSYIGPGPHANNMFHIHLILIFLEKHTNWEIIMDLKSIMADFPEAQSLEIFSEIAGDKKTIEETAGNNKELF